MGSASDWDVMQHCVQTLESLVIANERRVLSAHRTPQAAIEWCGGAKGRGLKVIIAGAGGAAHLPGMTAAKTRLPVIGVPVESHSLSGMDSLLSIVQMPGGVPVGTLAIGKAGAKRWRGIRPTVRGVAMNPIDHPHGGGEGRTAAGRDPVSPWGTLTKGYKTRHNKRTDNMIIRRRKQK
mgnify:CR=1 FL=1